MPTIDAQLPSTAAELNATSSEYDFVVLGTGEGAKYIAWALAKEGHRVGSVEQKYIGGSCPNVACLPSKNMIHSAKVASYFRRSEGLEIPKTVSESICPRSAIANEKWWQVSWTSMFRISRQAGWS